MTADAVWRAENIRPEMAAAKKEAALSCRALEKFETLRERLGPKYREEKKQDTVEVGSFGI